MKEFNSIEEATRALRASTGPVYAEFQLSAKTTTRYYGVYDRLVETAKGIGYFFDDGVLNELGFLGGVATTIYGIITLNGYHIARGAAAVARSAKEDDRRNKRDRDADIRLHRTIQANRSLNTELELLADFHAALAEHTKRLAAKTPPKSGHEYSFDCEAYQIPQTIQRTPDHGYGFGEGFSLKPGQIYIYAYWLRTTQQHPVKRVAVLNFKSNQSAINYGY